MPATSLLFILDSESGNQEVKEVTGMVKSFTGFLKNVSTLWQRKRPQSVRFGCCGTFGAAPGIVRVENSLVWSGYFSSNSFVKKSLSVAQRRACLSFFPPSESNTRMQGCLTGTSLLMSSSSSSLSEASDSDSLLSDGSSVFSFSWSLGSFSATSTSSISESLCLSLISASARLSSSSYSSVSLLS